MSGDGVVAHNRRTYFAENVDPTRTQLNVEYCYTPIEEAYHQLFDAALAEFNLKAKIQSLTAELSAVKAELAQYKSVRGKLRTADLEQENSRLRSKIRSYESAIERNDLWHIFNPQRNKTYNRDDAR